MLDIKIFFGFFGIYFCCGLICMRIKYMVEGFGCRVFFYLKDGVRGFNGVELCGVRNGGEEDCYC